MDDGFKNWIGKRVAVDYTDEYGKKRSWFGKVSWATSKDFEVEGKIFRRGEATVTELKDV